MAACFLFLLCCLIVCCWCVLCEPSELETGFVCPKAEKYSAAEIAELKEAIIEHEKMLTTKQATGIFKTGRSSAPFVNELNEKTEAFLCAAVTQTTGTDCKVYPDKSVKAHYYAIDKEEVHEFIKEEAMTEMPRVAADFLKASIEHTQLNNQKADSFSRIFSVKDGGASHNRLEVGHVFISVIYDGEIVYMLVLAPAVTATTSAGCRFSNQFHRNFQGDAQDVLSGLAVAAVRKFDYVDTINKFAEEHKQIPYEKKGTYSVYSKDVK